MREAWIAKARRIKSGDYPAQTAEWRKDKNTVWTMRDTERPAGWRALPNSFQSFQKADSGLHRERNSMTDHKTVRDDMPDSVFISPDKELDEMGGFYELHPSPYYLTYEYVRKDIAALDRIEAVETVTVLGAGELSKEIQTWRFDDRSEELFEDYIIRKYPNGLRIVKEKK